MTAAAVLVVDPDGDLVQRLADAWHEGEGPEIHHLARPGRLAAVAGATPSWQLIVVSAAARAAGALDALAEAAERARAIPLLVEQAPAGSTVADAANAALAGVPIGGLTATATPGALRDAVERALSGTGAAIDHAATSDHTRAVSRHAQVHVVVSAAGGVGRTTTALSLAEMLARSGQRVAVLDLDLQFGKAAAALARPRSRTIAELLFDERGRPHDASAIREALDELAPRPGEVALIGAPRDAVEADRVDDDQVGAVLAGLRTCADHVVVDTSAGLTPHTLAALDGADSVVVVAALDVPGLTVLRELLGLLDRLDVDPASRHVVLTKELAESGLPGHEAARLLGVPLAGVVPFDVEATRAANGGWPLSTGTGPAADALRGALSSLAPLPEAPVPAASAQPARRPLRERLFGLRAPAATTEHRS